MSLLCLVLQPELPRAKRSDMKKEDVVTSISTSTTKIHQGASARNNGGTSDWSGRARRLHFAFAI